MTDPSPRTSAGRIRKEGTSYRLRGDSNTARRLCADQRTEGKICTAASIAANSAAHPIKLHLPRTQAEIIEPGHGFSTRPGGVSGAVVTPAEELLVVVPADAGLEVEAVLENKDVGFIEPGQTAAIKVEAFPFTRYGLIEGEVMGVSRDAVIDERGQLVFKMRVRLSRQTILVNGREVPLSPGMNVTAEVKTGQRQLLDYFLSPLKRYRDESVRER